MFNKMLKARMLWGGVNVYSIKDNFVFFPEVLQTRNESELYRGTWQSPLYFKGVENDVRLAFRFDVSKLNDTTKSLLDMIRTCNSVSLHIRRNDYLSDGYALGFGGICTPDYYHRATSYIQQRIVQPRFIIFSDDIGWCQNNLDIPEAVYVDCNYGSESWQDMFLMSQCKHNIIANSSFSWWGAWLNAHPDKIVIAPDKWWHGINDDVVPPEWIRLSGINL